MDELIKQLGQTPGGEIVTVTQAAAAIVTSFFLSLVLVYVYRETHQGTSYSQSFAHTLVIMCVVVSVIMLIIGSNIARAFSLVGALSIIRFRTAVKEARDVAFLFLAMAVGMACGTKFYSIGLTLVFFICPIAFFLSKFNIGAKPFSEVILKLVVSKDLDHHVAFDDLLHQQLQSHVLLSVDAVDDDTLELVYSVKFKSSTTDSNLLESLRAPDGCRKVSIVKGLQNINV